MTRETYPAIHFRCPNLGCEAIAYYERQGKDPWIFTGVWCDNNCPLTERDVPTSMCPSPLA